MAFTSPTIKIQEKIGTVVEEKLTASFEEKKKIEGVTFWCMLLVAASKDGMEVFAGMSFFVPGVGFVIAAIAFMYGMLVLGILFGFLKYSGVTIGEKILRRIIIVLILSVIPLLNMLPQTTWGLITIRMIHNNKVARVAAEVIEQAEAIKSSFMSVGRLGI